MNFCERVALNIQKSDDNFNHFSMVVTMFFPPPFIDLGAMLLLYQIKIVL